MKMDRRLILLKIAGLGGLERYVELRTRDLGDILSVSQQSASIYLRELEDSGSIERIKKKSGGRVRITAEGIEELRALLEELRSILEKGHPIPVRGQITEGLGEGAYYMSQRGYVEQIEKKLGFTPYKGTLNVQLRKEHTPVLDLLRRGPGILIEEFSSGDRTFGRCLCYPCTVEGIRAVVMAPVRSIHRDSVELIAESRLRDLLPKEKNAELDLLILYPAHEGNGRFDVNELC